MEEEFFIIRYRGSAENRNAIYEHLTGKVKNNELYSALLKDMAIGRAKTMHDILDLPKKAPRASPIREKVKEEVEDIDEKYINRVTYHSFPGESIERKEQHANKTSEENKDDDNCDSERMPTTSGHFASPPVRPHSPQAPNVYRVGRSSTGFPISESFTSISKHNQATQASPYAEYLAGRRRRSDLSLAHNRRYANLFERKPEVETISSQMLKLHNIRIERRS